MTTQPDICRPKRRWAVVAGLAGVVCLALALAGLYWAKPLLFVEGGSRSADAIVLLGGQAEHRVFRAIELFKSGAAPQVLVSGTGDEGYTQSLLVLAGVPQEAVSLENHSRNTKENTEYSVRWLKEHSAKRAIIVTSWFHSRRALACFRRFADGIELSSYPAYHGASMEDKPSLREAFDVLREYVAIAWYYLRYGISPADSFRGQPVRRKSTMTLEQEVTETTEIEVGLSLWSLLTPVQRSELDRTRDHRTTDHGTRDQGPGTTRRLRKCSPFTRPNC